MLPGWYSNAWFSAQLYCPAAQSKNQTLDPSSDEYKEQNKQLRDQLNLLQEKIDKEEKANNLTPQQTAQLTKQVDELKKVNKELASALTLNKKIADTFGKHGKDLVTYLGHLGMWFEKGQQIATEYFSIQRNIGLSEDMPEKMLIHWVVIKEPNKFTDYDGRIFILAESATEEESSALARFFGYRKEKIEPRL